MTSTTQKQENKNENPVDFSKAIFSSAHLRKPKLENTNFGNITDALGPFIQDDHGNIFYDLRFNSEKPFWGHSLPLTLKYSFKALEELPKEVISFNNLNQQRDLKKSYLVKDVFFSEDQLLPKELANLETLFLYFSPEIILEYSENKIICQTPPQEKLVSYIETVLIRGKRIQDIQSQIKIFSEGHANITARGLNIIIKDSKATPEDFANECLYINESNYIKNQLYLSFPTSFTKVSITDLFERISHVLRKIECL